MHLVEEGLEPDEVTFLTMVKACSIQKNVELTKQIYTCILETGIKMHAHLGNILLNIHFKSGSLEDAWKVFDAMVERDVITWTTMIGGQSKHGHAEWALRLFQQMQQEGIDQDAMTFVSVLSACASEGILETGRHVHACILSMGEMTNIFLANTLVDMYATCGSIEEAHKVFTEMHERDVVSWNALIAGNAKNGYFEEALKLFWHMCWDGLKWNRVTFLSIINALASMGNPKLCKQLHAIMMAVKLESTAFLDNALVDMYGKCGSLKEAQHVFKTIKRPDVAAWTAMITSYVKHGCGEDALNVFWKMVKRGVKPNEITYVSVLNACADLEQVEKVHKYIFDTGITPNVFMGNTLIAMYAKFGSLDLARQVFDSMTERNVVSWTSIISGYVKQGHPNVAFQLYERMEGEGVQPNEVTFLCILNACASTGCLDLSRQIHDHMIQSGIQFNDAMQNALVDMYVKCGRLEDAYDVMPKEDMATWAASVIEEYTSNGKNEESTMVECETR